ncbi:hypothetical protein ABPG72_009941 [Tetrahymena utriculariae]
MQLLKKAINEKNKVNIKLTSKSKISQRYHVQLSKKLYVRKQGENKLTQKQSVSAKQQSETTVVTQMQKDNKKDISPSHSHEQNLSSHLLIQQNVKKILSDFENLIKQKLELVLRKDLNESKKLVQRNCLKSDINCLKANIIFKTVLLLSKQQ